jgi:hypothetical protein
VCGRGWEGGKEGEREREGGEEKGGIRGVDKV